MKILFCFVLISVPVFVSEAQSETLTNHISWGDHAVSLSITDESVGRSKDARYFDKEIAYDAPLFWILQNTTNRNANLRFEGIQRTFSLKLFDRSGREVPLTPFGKEMNSGPEIATNRPVAGSVHFIGLSPRQVDVRNFPAMNKLFEISESGEYFAEIRLWYRDVSRGEWRLSSPIRLKVSKPRPFAGSTKK